MEVIVDSCVLISALLDEPNNDYCWEIIKLIRTKKLIPITCEYLSREYICTPQKLARTKVKENLHKAESPDAFFEEVFEDLYDISKDMVQIISYAKCVNVESRLKVCILDHKDNKLVDLAYDSDCNIIVTNNIGHIKIAENQGIKTKYSKKPIRVFTPEEFYIYFYSRKWVDSQKL
ncbi:MAG: putative toxin-antitoxin system toxin component, PIN family [Caulobacteraceae bacterium]